MEEENIDLLELEDEADEGLAPSVSSPEGEVLMAWMVDEYRAHERGPLWYGAAVTFGFGMLIFALITQNFLFAVMVVMFGVLVGLSAIRRPGRVPFVVTDLGIVIGGTFHAFKELKAFWMIYEPPEVKTLYIEFRQSVLPHLIVPIDDQNPLDIRATLGHFVPEDLSKEEEPFMDWLGRLLKI